MHQRFFDVNRFHYDAGFSPLCAMIVDLFLTLLPIALLIALGAGLRQQNFLADAFWPQAERLCYFILLPPCSSTAWPRPICAACPLATWWRYCCWRH